MSSDGSNAETEADELVVRAKTDRDAFGQLYERFVPLVYGYCHRRLFDSAMADDLSSEVFLQVARAISRFPGKTETDFQRWVYRIATNAVNAHLRQGLRHGDLLRRAVDERHLRGPESSLRPASHSEAELDAVKEAVSQLDLREQTVLALRFMEGLSYEAVGEVMNVRPATLRVVASRALKDVRRRLSKRLNSAAIQHGESPAS